MKTIILAAGAGKRMNSETDKLPKVLRKARGKELIRYILEKLDSKPEDIIIVTGFMRELVEQALGDKYRYAVQAEQKGTGHAVSCALPALEGYQGPVLIVNGDMPLLTRKSISGLLEVFRETQAGCVLLAADVKDSGLPYGRIVRDGAGCFEKIVEDKDCSPAQKLITELNIGVYVVEAELLRRYLGMISCNNAQGEFYLTDLPELLRSAGVRVEIFDTDDVSEAFGVNTPDDLKKVESLL